MMDDLIDRTKDENLKNQIMTSDNKEFLNFDIDDVFYHQVIKDMPQNMTNLEKTIYVYLKLCSLLTYDEEYYASRQSEEVNLKHADINNLSKISLNNNSIICYEFNAIFAKILDKMGYKFRVNLQNEECLPFGYGHTNLTYLCDEYIVNADSVTSVLCGDLQLVKRGKMPVGLSCSNSSLELNREFSYALEEMSELVKDQTIKTNHDFIANLEKYKELSKDKKIDITFQEKIEMFFELLFKANLNGIDAIGYINVLVNGLFNSNMKKSIDVTIVTEVIENLLKPTVIFTINNDIKDSDNNLYICFNPPDKLRRFNHDEIQELFDNNVFVFRDKVVPGIVGVRVSDIRRH